MRWLIILFFVLFTGCVSTQKNSDIDLTGQELNRIESDANLTPEQKIIIKHAEASLRDAVVINKENSKLENKVISESKEAGAGTLIYWIIGAACLIVVMIFGMKAIKKLP